jgi:hypothetical protein
MAFSSRHGDVAATSAQYMQTDCNYLASHDAGRVGVS